jgi:hypothetical protein
MGRNAYLKLTEQFLSGTSLTNWLRLLCQNRLGVGWRYLPRALYLTFVTLATLPFRVYERLRFDPRVAATRIEKPPVFILGHWRSGTTYLHVLMAQDRSFAYATNLQVILPELFLGSSKLFEGAVRRFLPHKRWMDEFLLAPHLPSEDEFAVANLCSRSMYHSLPFPQNRYFYVRYCTMDGVPEREVREWQGVLLYLLKKLTYSAGGRRLLLKNPTYTARITYLLELFPGAKFVHIYRNPYEVFCSTMRMYEKMFPSFYLQEPRGDAKEFILGVYQRMHEKYFAEKGLIPEGSLVEVRYEDFISEPLREVERVYQGLGLAGFEEARSAFAAYIAAQKSFQVNRNALDEPLRREVAARWQSTFEAWGYPLG